MVRASGSRGAGSISGSPRRARVAALRSRMKRMVRAFSTCLVSQISADETEAIRDQVAGRVRELW